MEVLAFCGTFRGILCGTFCRKPHCKIVRSYFVVRTYASYLLVALGLNTNGDQPMTRISGKPCLGCPALASRHKKRLANRDGPKSSVPPTAPGQYHDKKRGANRLRPSALIYRPFITSSPKVQASCSQTVFMGLGAAQKQMVRVLGLPVITLG
jgi:hypothetical protein